MRPLLHHADHATSSMEANEPPEAPSSVPRRRGRRRLTAVLVVLAAALLALPALAVALLGPEASASSEATTAGLELGGADPVARRVLRMETACALDGPSGSSATAYDCGGTAVVADSRREVADAPRAARRALREALVDRSELAGGPGAIAAAVRDAVVSSPAEGIHVVRAALPGGRSALTRLEATEGGDALVTTVIGASDRVDEIGAALAGAAGSVGPVGSAGSAGSASSPSNRPGEAS